MMSVTGHYMFESISTAAEVCTMLVPPEIRNMDEFNLTEPARMLLEKAFRMLFNMGTYFVTGTTKWSLAQMTTSG